MCRYRQPGMAAVLTQDSAEEQATSPAQEESRRGSRADEATRVTAEMEERIGAMS